MCILHLSKVIISETSIRSDLQLDDAEGTYCLPTATIFAELERMFAKTTSWNEFSSTMASAIIFFLDKQVEGMSKHKGVYVTPSHTKKVFANMKRPCKGFSGRVTPLFSTMMVQATEDMEPITEETILEEHVSTPFYDPPPRGKDKMKLAELMSLCTNLQEKVLDLEKAKTAQAKEITSLKKKVKQLEKRRKSRTSGLRRLRKVAVTSAATTTTTTRPKARRVIVQEPSEFKKTSSPLQASQLTQAKDKGKEKMVEPEKLLKKKDQITMDEEVARNLEAQLQAELEEEERISRLNEEKANIDLLESWDNIQAMMDADFQLAQQMQIEEQEHDKAGKGSIKCLNTSS
ncbi:hypothetical protein Tco_0281103 [Tanacetum coccineum]